MPASESKRPPERLAAQKRICKRWRALAIFVVALPLCGCSERLAFWRIQSCFEQCRLSPKLCEYKGTRIAIVPGKALAKNETARVARFTSVPPGHQVVSSNGDVIIYVDGQQKQIVEGGSKMPPESVAALSSFYEEMGFEVVDRVYVEEVLAEQDIQAVFGNNVQHVGRQLGVDVLALVSCLVSPAVYFVSSSEGGWSYYTNLHFREHVDYISVSDGSRLGSHSGSASLLSLTGHTHLEAKNPSGSRRTIVFRAYTDDGTYTEVGQINFVPEIRRVAERSKKKMKELWEDLCHEGQQSK